ncbi:MAG: methyltransferase domain-containing protein [Patescibacteria group bacterium]
MSNRDTEKENNFRQREYSRLATASHKLAQIKLHFGCGPRILKDWVNIDLFFEPFADYLKFYGDKYYSEAVRGDQSDFYAVDITRTGLPFADDSVDLIFHEDFIEHLSQKDQIIFLAETCRVLKPGAVHRINTPNLLESMKDSSDFSKGQTGVYVAEWDRHGHRSLLTPSHLKELAFLVGYSNVIFNGQDESIALGVPLEYRPGNDRPEQGNIFADLIK